MTPTQAQLCECDCLNYCGDDPHIRERKAHPCRNAIDWAHEQALAIEAEREKERKLALFESQAKQIAGYIEQHGRDSAELRRLCSERDEAKRDAKSWKDHAGICNQANERMQNAAYEAGCPDEIDVAEWILQTIEDKSAIIAALRKALAYWIPKVFDERSAHDAYLLVGYEGETEPECWGDSMVARVAEIESTNEALSAHSEEMARRIAELEAKVAAAEKATRFAGLVLAQHRNDGYPGDVDGDDLQRFALESGMIEERLVESSCGSECSCADVGEFPTTCYFNTEAGKAAIAASKEQS